MKRLATILSALTLLAACTALHYLPTSCPRCQRTYFDTAVRIESTNVIHEFRCRPCKWVWSATNQLSK